MVLFRQSCVWEYLLPYNHLLARCLPADNGGSEWLGEWYP